MSITRREALATLAVATAAGTALGAEKGEKKEAKPAAEIGKHQPKPLPFDPKKLKGISEKMILSHHDNNYTGAVKSLNKVEEELSHLTKDSPPFLWGGLKERELTFTNSMVLHELYFGNLGGEGKPAGAIEKALGAAHGSFGKWEEQFRATGASLGGGSGWVVLDYGLLDGELHTYWSGGHAQTAALGAPLLVMDMYEHAYQLDHGAGFAKYIDAFFQSLNWEEVDRRYERAQKASALLRG